MTTTWHAWVNLMVAVVLIISPFIFGFSDNTNAMWTAICAGAIVTVVSLLELVYPTSVPRPR
jgi:hypothetical protein